MKGKNIIQLFREEAAKDHPDVVDKIQFLAAEAQMKMFDIHARAMGCMCECLGMNAENMWSATSNQSLTFSIEHYYQVMRKWGVTEEKGEPLI